MNSKPIRSTTIIFNNQDEYDSFVQYANSEENSYNEQLDRVRRELRKHKRSKRRTNNDHEGHNL